ncbi:MAG: KpsF/GutQ family sugar-phosphate isomerase [Pirellulales bacterium]|nr:KpsF/GutQ family sugar-phosphate isomerase [Pirellulales bacterium]
MSTEAVAYAGEWNSFEQLRLGREIIRAESKALDQVAARLGEEFCRAVQCLFHCRGEVIVCGIGKAGIVGQKIMATLASTGTPAHFLHPAEAVHGDLGRLRRGDVVLLLSQSGETEEIVRLLPMLHELGVTLVAITARSDSALGRSAAVTIELGTLEEACFLGLAPSTSTTAMMAVGDALALVVSRRKRFRREDFARLHPGGNLGLKLSKVEDLMRPLPQCRVAREDRTIREVLIEAGRPGRRTGATMLVDADGRLSGIFTDSDLARLFEQRRDGDLDGPVARVMTRNPLKIAVGTRMAEAVALLAERKISELPVVDAEGRPQGLIDITDVVALLPHEGAVTEPSHSAPSAGTAVGPWRVISPAVEER